MFRMRTVAVLLATLIALALPACGDGDGNKGKLLSPTTASSLQNTIDQVEQTTESRDCTTAQARAKSLAQQVNSLGTEVDPDLRRALSSAAERLQSLVERQCKPAVTTAPPAEEPPAETQPKEEKQTKKEEKAQEKQDEGKGNKHETTPEEQPPDQQQQQGTAEGTTGTGGVTP